MEGMGLKFTPVIGRDLLCHSSMFGPIAGTSGTHIASPNSLNREFNPSLASHPPLHLPLSLLAGHPL